MSKETNTLSDDDLKKVRECFDKLNSSVVNLVKELKERDIIDNYARFVCQKEIENMNEIISEYDLPVRVDLNDEQSEASGIDINLHSDSSKDGDKIIVQAALDGYWKLE